MVVAALMADGTSEIEEIGHIERGYENIVESCAAWALRSARWIGCLPHWNRQCDHSEPLSLFFRSFPDRELL